VTQKMLLDVQRGLARNRARTDAEFAKRVIIIGGTILLVLMALAACLQVV